jgi:carbamoyl-phosphate synthase small subunit
MAATGLSMEELAPQIETDLPAGATAALVLADGSVFWGSGFGAHGISQPAELCFSTGMTGYQETLTDPSFAGQIITFTFPHIGNVGTNEEDLEATNIAARGLVTKEDLSAPANWRARESLDSWLKKQNIPGISGIDTRALTLRIRDLGAPNAILAFPADAKFDIAALTAQAAAWPGLTDMDLAAEVSCTQSYEWTEGRWNYGHGFAKTEAKHTVVAVDYGAKRNILRALASAGCKVTIVPANATSEDVLRHKPDGIFLSNGPGDPAATGVYAVPVIKELIASNTPIFGICLGHQLLSLAVGGRTEKMHHGHRGANHPVKELATGKVEITSQNHGFVVIPESLPANCEATHVSLFDGSNEGFRMTDKPVFAVQYHPEASPGPKDSHHLFDRFVRMMDAVR